jgi:hypothetical protein
MVESFPGELPEASQAADHLKQHPEMSWEKSVLRDMDACPWTVFKATP